jgi:hypothetical protein
VCIIITLSLIMTFSGVWFAFNMAWLAVCSYGLVRLMKYLEILADGTLILRVKVSHNNIELVQSNILIFNNPSSGLILKSLSADQ